MIGYVTLGTNDLPRAEAFYNELMKEFGATVLLQDERMRFYGSAPDKPILSICTPYDGEAGTVGNGVMVALQGGDKAGVDRIHAKAIELGATDDGAPGDRGAGFYGAYFRDLDGNKFAVYVIGA